MEIIIVLVILAIILYSLLKNKKEEEEIEDEEELILSLFEELKKLKVYYNGKEIQEGSILKINNIEQGCFLVKGYNVKGEELALSGLDLSWHASCQVVHWQRETGLSNCVTCNCSGIRSVWVKYTNGVSFRWKIEFVN